jgi:hypothetical protein
MAATANQPFKEQLETLEKTSKLYSNVVEFMDDILKRTKEQRQLQRDLVKEQLDELKILNETGAINDELYDKKKNLLEAELAILEASTDVVTTDQNLIKIFAKRLKMYEAFIEEQKKSITLETALRKAGLGWLYDTVKLVGEYGYKNAVILTTIAGMALLVRELFRDFRAIDGAAAEFRKTIGITRDDSAQLEEIARNITFQFANMGVTAADVYKSMLAVTAAIGSSQALTQDMVADMTLLSVQLGVAESTSAEFLRVMGQLGQSTMDAQKNTALFTAKLSAAAGTNLNEVMNDIASASKSSYQFLTKDPLVLSKAAVEAKRMGTSLESATKTSSSLLNFTQSVKDEMEASVLVGKSINLQKARELAYHRDIRGLNKEILSIAKQTNFENLDPFQQDAVARALGKSADELAKMLQADREMDKIRHSTDPSIQKQVESYDRLVNANKQLADDEAKNYSLKLAELANAEALKTITLAMHGILQRLLQGPITLIAKGLTGIAKVLNWINDLMKKWLPLGAAALSWVDDLLVAVLAIGGAFVFGKIFKIFGVGGKVQNLFGGLGKGIGDFAKNLMSKLKNVGSFMESISMSIKKSILNISRGIGSGIKVIFKRIAEGLEYLSKPKLLMGALVLAALGASLIPFAYGMKLLTGISWKTFGIAAASLGLLVVAAAALGALMMSGVGAGALLLGAAAIAILGASLIPAAYAMKIAGEGFKSLGDGLKETVDSLVELQQLSFLGTIKEIFMLTASITALSKAISTMPKVDITPLSKYANVAVDINKPVGKKEQQKTAATNDDIVSAINKGFDDLRKDFKSGTLTANVYIDSQKLDALMGRRLAYTGQLT